MDDISLNNILIVILASFQLLSLLRPKLVEIFQWKTYIIEALITIACCSAIIGLLKLLPQIFPLILVFAVAGAVEIIRFATNKLKKYSFIANDEKKYAESAVSSESINKAKLSKNIEVSDNITARNNLRIGTDNNSINQTTLHSIKDKLIQSQERETKYLQEISYLSQELQDLKTQINNKKCKVEKFAPNTTQVTLAHQDPKTEQSANLPITQSANISNEVKVCLEQIADLKRDIENLFSQINRPKEEARPWSVQNPEDSTGENGECLEPNRQDKTELSPFLHGFIVPAKTDAKNESELKANSKTTSKNRVR